MEHGFYGRLTADFSSQVLVDATEVCNPACIHCQHPVLKKQGAEYVVVRRLHSNAGASISYADTIEDFKATE